MRALSILLVATLCACQSNSMKLFKTDASYTFHVAKGADFKHQVIENPSLSKVLAARENNDHQGRQTAISRALHVYIEGDGRPWKTPYIIASDPTVSYLPVLELMYLDDSPSLYLGRPCYFGLEDPLCEPKWWTDKRYSETVINSMKVVLDSYTPLFDELIFIGHSGGGAIAKLLTSRTAKASALVTLAANLDIDAWTSHHGYTPLEGSLNPADYVLDKTIRQVHYIGANDKSVPAEVLKHSLPKHNQSKHNQSKNNNVTFQVFPDFDHRCCWQSIWPETLDLLKR